MSEDVVMRRTPKQRRGQERVTQILDAADRLIAQQGYAQVSTNGIAKEAQISIGSVYQFFSNKEAVYLALAERYVDKLNAVMTNAILLGEDAPPLSVQFNELIDQLILFYKQNPGFQPLFFGSYATVASADEIMCRMVDGMESLLEPLSPVPIDCRLQAEVIMDTLKGTLPLITSDDELRNQLAVVEIKKLLLGYLQAIIVED